MSHTGGFRLLPENMARVPHNLAAPLTFWRESCDKWPTFERFEASPLFMALLTCLKREKGSAYILADAPIILSNDGLKGNKLQKKAEKKMVEQAGLVDREDHLYPDNPVDPPLATFDTNIVIALRNNEADVRPIRQLLALNCAGAITIHVTLNMAFEEQLDGHEYESWLQEEGIAPENIFTVPHAVSFSIQHTPAITFVFDTHRERMLSEGIHQILFPTVPYTWVDYRSQECVRLVETKCKALLELDALCMPSSPLSPAYFSTEALDALKRTEQEEVCKLHRKLHRKWMNAKNDALGLYSHLSHVVNTTYPERAVFVTNDHNFLKQTKVAELRRLGFLGKILQPAEAVMFLHNITGTILSDR